jgi:TetR/AcrR family transcriptional regulator
MEKRLNHEVQADRAAETKRRILEAAQKEFAEKGLAGARTEQIAVAARVNKALIYYYFESKEKLYIAAFDLVAARVLEGSMAVFQRGSSPGERLLRAALYHFDRILTQREFQRLLQQEMIRLHKGEAGVLPAMVKNVFAPQHAMYEAIIREGIESSELVEVDWFQVLLAALGANIIYFMSAPIWRLVMEFEPFAPDSLRRRRVVLVEFLGQAIFIDREHGARLAARILADTPMPDCTEFSNARSWK